MTALAPTVEVFFTQRLATERDASPHTVAAYRDTLRLLFVFAQEHTGKAPSRLDVGDIDAELVAAFLTHLETDRGNSVSTRNARLTAIHSLFRYAALRHPEHAESIQRVLAIPAKRHEQTVVCFLTRRRSMRCYPRPTATPGSADVITPCSRWPSKPACGSPN